MPDNLWRRYQRVDMFRSRLILAVSLFWFGLNSFAPALRADEPKSAPAISGAARAQLVAERDALQTQAKKLRAESKFREARQLQEKQLAVLQRLHGEAHEQLADTLETMAYLSCELRDFDRAGELFQQMIEVQTRLYGPDSSLVRDTRLEAAYFESLGRDFTPQQLDMLDTARRQMEQAYNASDQARWFDAIKLADQAEEIRRQVLGVKHFRYAETLMVAGRCHLGAGQLGVAKGKYLKALDIYRQQYGVHWTVGHCLNSLGLIAENQGDLKASEAFYEEGLELRMQLYPVSQFPDGHAEIATLHNNLALLRDKQGKYESALKHYLKALEMRTRLYPVDEFPDGHDHLATSLNNIGTYYIHQDQKLEAKPYLEASLQMRRKLYGGEEFPNGHPKLATSLANYGAFLRKVGDYEAARGYSDECLKMSRRLYPQSLYPKGHVRLVNALLIAGKSSQDAGEIDDALGYFRESLLMLNRLLPAAVVKCGHPVLVSVLSNLMQVHQLRGDFENARHFARQAIAMAERVYPQDEYPNGHRDLALTLMDHAILMLEQADFAEAYIYGKRSLEMNRRLYPPEKYPQGHFQIATALDQLGFVYAKLDRPAESKSHHLQAIAMQRRLADASTRDSQLRIATMLNNLAVACHLKGELDEAEGYLCEAVSALEEQLEVQESQTLLGELASHLGNLSWTQRALGKYQDAFEAQLRATEIMYELYPPDAYPLGNTFVAFHCYKLGLVLFAKGQDAEALSWASRGLAVYHLQTSTFAAAASEVETARLIHDRSYVRDCWLSISLAVDEPAARIYGTLWDDRHLAYRTLANRQRASLAAAATDGVADFQEYLATRRAYSRLALSPLSPEGGVAALRKERLAELTRRKEELERRLAKSIPTIAKQLDPDGQSASELLKHLPPHGAFVDIVQYKSARRGPDEGVVTYAVEYVAFVLAAGKVSAVPLGHAEPIDAAVSDWRNQLVAKASSTIDDTRRADLKLKKLIWDKLESAIPSAVETVFICADGDLSTLPWATLPGQNVGSVLLERYGFVLVPHGHFLWEQLQEVEPADGKSGSHLLISNVDYDSQKLPVVDIGAVTHSRAARDVNGKAQWGSLPATSQEAAAISRLLKEQPNTHLAGAEANVARVLEELPKARRAHLATHGFFADEKFQTSLQLDADLIGGDSPRNTAARNPLVLSGIVLAGANQPPVLDELGLPKGPGGILTAEAIAGLPLHNLDLVTLSACESGLGTIRGENVYGLQRAFHVSGTKTVVSSLWKVDDKATQQLMLRFYENLYAKKMSKLDALRHAQLSFLYGTTEFTLDRSLRRKADSQVKTLPAVASWGAWTISGDWR